MAVVLQRGQLGIQNNSKPAWRWHAAMGVHISSQLVRWARKIYKSLPLSRSSKRRLASFGYKLAGSLFRGEPHYEFWRLNQSAGVGALVARAVVQPNEFGEVLAATRFESIDQPTVSVVIPCHGNLGSVLRCLRSIKEFPPKASIEIIVAEDGSGDHDIWRLAQIPGLRLLVHPQRLGAIDSVNFACRSARGRYVQLLGSDTEVGEGWLDSKLAIVDRLSDCGLVGSKLVDKESRLLEAGGIVWRDGTSESFGRFADPSLPAFNYRKEVDYCSAVSVLAPKSLWDELGGFDARYASARYADIDLAFRVRAAGKKVVYQPASVVISHGDTPPACPGAEVLMASDQNVFFARWSSVLHAEHLSPGESLVGARDRSATRKIVLVIDHYVPQPDVDAGSRTIWCMLRVLQSMGFNTKFCPTSLWRDPVYTSRIQQEGIEVFYGDDHDVADWVRECGDRLAYVLLSRPDVAKECIELVRQNSRAKVLYYGHDLHFQRALGEYEHTRDERLLRESEKFRAIEESIWRAVDVVYYPSPSETNTVRSLVPEVLARTIAPYFFDDEEVWAGLAPRRRHELMFVAGFGHAPNVDAAVWLVKEIFLRVKTHIPDAKLLLIGSKPTDEVKALAGASVQVTGYVSDETLIEYYRNVGVAVAPMRFGAGVKGKVVEALHHGLPLVTTSVGVQGLEGLDEVIPVSDDARVIADAIIRLMQDDDYWKSVASGGRKYADARFSRAALCQVFEQDLTP